MSVENQNPDFEALRRLLKLKHHEQPPPRYFHGFSSQVISRIRAGTPGGRFESFEDIIAQSSWMRRIWSALEGKPAVSGLVAASVCGLLLGGVLMSENAPPTLSPLLAGGTDNAAKPAPEDNLFATTQLGTPNLMSSTNPAAMLPGGNLFESMPRLGQPRNTSGLPMLK
jgi:hypothetical protein